MMLVSLDDAKTYLRVDTSDDDDLIDILLKSSRQLCADVARLSAAEAAEIETGDGFFVEGSVEDTDAQGLSADRDAMRIAELYALGYLYEHREEADHHELTLTLRSLLFSVREGRMYENRTTERENSNRKEHRCC